MLSQVTNTHLHSTFIYYRCIFVISIMCHLLNCDFMCSPKGLLKKQKKSNTCISRLITSRIITKSVWNLFSKFSFFQPVWQMTSISIRTDIHLDDFTPMHHSRTVVFCSTFRYWESTKRWLLQDVYWRWPPFFWEIISETKKKFTL